MAINPAVDAYLAATSVEEVRAAFASMVEGIAADDDLPEDADFEAGVDHMLNQMGLPPLAERIYEVQMAEIRSSNG